MDKKGGGEKSPLISMSNFNINIIASGSKGNCYIIETQNEKLLLECGINFKTIQKELEFSFSSVVGCLLSHEHRPRSFQVYKRANKAIYKRLFTPGHFYHSWD